jgi:hypothetical protein
MMRWGTEVDGGGGPAGGTCGGAADPRDGSVLVEAIVGVALLALLTTSLMGFNLSLTSAQRISELTIVGVRLANAHVESATRAADPAELHRQSAEHPALSSVLSVQMRPVPVDGGCLPAGATEVRSQVATVRSEADAEAPLLRLLATRFEPPSGRRALPDGTVAHSSVLVGGSSLAGVEITVTAVGSDGVDDGGAGAERSEPQSSAAIDADGCLRLPPLLPGRHVLVPSGQPDGPQPIDAAHRTGSALAYDVSVLEVPFAGSWALALSSAVTVRAELDGARPPDRVRSGALRWMVRGDDARVMTDLGEPRALHPGPVVVVVSACLNPEAHGSEASAVVPETGALEVDVPLATVVLQGLAGREDHAITAMATATCADGTGLLSLLRWERALHDGMRIALPHGEWQLTVRAMTGGPSTFPINVLADGSGQELTFP